jgi:hypothetical protein
MVTNMLGKMRIRCIYDKNGCKEVLMLENLENHEKLCRFNKKICEKCFCGQSLNHDCVKSLLDSKQELIKSNEELQKELKIATDKISSMKSEIQNYLQTIQELTNFNVTDEKPCNTKEVLFLWIRITVCIQKKLFLINLFTKYLIPFRLKCSRFQIKKL